MNILVGTAGFFLQRLGSWSIRVISRCATGRSRLDMDEMYAKPIAAKPMIRLQATRQYSSGKSRVVADRSASVIIHQLLPGICLVAAQQSKPMNHAVLVLCDIGWFQFAPVPDCMTGHEAGRRLLRSLECS